MDIAIHWGLIRYLKKEVKFNPIIPLIAIIIDLIILTAFIYLKYLNDPFALIVSAIGISLILVSERLFMKSHTDSRGHMNMGMDDDKKM